MSLSLASCTIVSLQLLILAGFNNSLPGAEQWLWISFLEESGATRQQIVASTDVAPIYPRCVDEVRMLGPKRFAVLLI